MYGAHEPLRRIQHQGDFVPLPKELVSETTPCIIPSASENRNFLPLNFVSLPSVEEGHVTLRQQTSLGAMTSEEQPSGVKNWHHKAIRRNLSKAKELVLYVGGLKCNLPAAKYVGYATECAKTEKKSSIGPVFPSLGCLFVTFSSGTSAALARKRFCLTRFCDRIPDLTFLPYISVPQNSHDNIYDPLLVFINCKSGGGQGSQLHELLLETLNYSQVFLMDKNGAIPGLYAFRKLARFRVLVCGGDGTVGWVLSHLDKVQRHLRCPDPPMAVLPVGTGNDLARVLGYGSGWGGENVDAILAQIHDSEPVGMDRWNVMFDSVLGDKVMSPDPLLLSNAVSLRSGDEDQVQRPVSPINIVMSLGGVPSPVSKSPVLDQRHGVKTLMASAVPVLTQESSRIDTIFPYDKTMSKNNNHCDSTELLYDERTASSVNVHASQTDISLDKLTIAADSLLVDNSNLDALSTDKTQTEVVVVGKITSDVSLAEEPSSDRSKSQKAIDGSAFDLAQDFTKPDPNTMVQVERSTDGGLVTDNLISFNDEAARDTLLTDKTLPDSDCDSQAKTTTDIPITAKSTPDNLALDTSAQLLTPIDTSPNLISLDSPASGEVSPTLLRTRSRNSSRRRLVQILSASDLDFGPFMGYEEQKDDEVEESGEQLKRKASMLKLIDTNDAKTTEPENISTDVESTSENLTSVDSTNLGNNVFKQSSSALKDDETIPFSHSPHIQRIASDTAVKRNHKPFEVNKKLSLPTSSNFSEPNHEPSPSDDGVKMVVMNNYFGIGIDAELTLAFHLAREENPEKCTSRLRNKALYFKAGLKKMTSRSVNLNHVIELEVNNKVITLPSLRGLIFLNISSWGAGAKPWGSGVSKRFDPPAFGDGKLEIIGVGGVAHMSQIYSGLRTGTRIAQGEYIKMTLKAEVAVQIDGEPWMQPPGKIVISTSPHQAVMLKKIKKKSK